AGVVEGAGVAVVAARARVGGHGAARRAVAGPGVARIRGARDGGVVADARVTAVDGAGVPVVAVGDRGAGRAAGDGRVVADARVAGLGSAGVLVVAVGGGGGERGAGDGGAGALPAAVADVVEGTRVAVVARRVGRLEDVRRAVHARPRAGLGYVACAGRGVADGARVGGRVNAPAAPVALLRAAHVVVVLACGAGRGRRTRARPGLTAVPGGAGVAVVARGAVRLRGAGADAALAGVVARAGVLVVARGAVEQRSVADTGAVLAGVGGGAGVAVVARRTRVGGHGAARCAVAGPRVAL